MFFVGLGWTLNDSHIYLGLTVMDMTEESRKEERGGGRKWVAQRESETDSDRDRETQAGRQRLRL